MVVQCSFQWFSFGYEDFAQVAHCVCRVHGDKCLALGTGCQYGRWQPKGKAVVQYYEHTWRFVKPGRSGTNSLFDDFD